MIGLLPLLIALTLQTPTPPEPTFAAAIARLQANDPAGAATILDQVVAREPRNGRAWRNLGAARQATKEYDKAIAAYQQALAVEPSMPTPMFQLGLVYALKHDVERAFEWLQRARETHRVDMTQAAEAAELAGLKEDPRFKALLPARADFDKPFVEDVRDHPRVGRRIGQRSVRLDRAQHRRRRRRRDCRRRHVGADGETGTTRRPRVRVFDEDGQAAVVRGRRRRTGSARHGRRSGRRYQPRRHSGRDRQRARRRVREGLLAAATARVLQTLRAEDKADAFGTHASGVGDVDKDGCADVIVGAPGAAARASAAPTSIRARTGRLLLTLSGERAGDRFGSAVAGDSHGGRFFILVGAPRAGESRHTAGRTSTTRFRPRRASSSTPTRPAERWAACSCRCRAT